MSTSIIRGKYLISRAGESEDTSLVIADGAVFQRDGLIVDLGSYQSLRSRYEADDHLGGPEYLVLPGLVNAHHHGRGFPGDLDSGWMGSASLRPLFDDPLHRTPNVGVGHHNGDVQPSPNTSRDIGRRY